MAPHGNICQFMTQLWQLIAIFGNIWQLLATFGNLVPPLLPKLKIRCATSISYAVLYIMNYHKMHYTCMNDALKVMTEWDTLWDYMVPLRRKRALQFTTNGKSLPGKVCKKQL